MVKFLRVACPNGQCLHTHGTFTASSITHRSFCAVLILTQAYFQGARPKGVSLFPIFAPKSQFPTLTSKRICAFKNTYFSMPFGQNAAGSVWASGVKPR